MLRGGLRFEHFIYGLRLRANNPIPTGAILGELNYDFVVDVRPKERSAVPTPYSRRPDYLYLSKNRNSEGERTVEVARLGRDFYGFYYIDGARFAVSRWGNEIWMDWPGEYSLEDAGIPADQSLAGVGGGAFWFTRFPASGDS